LPEKSSALPWGRFFWPIFSSARLILSSARLILSSARLILSSARPIFSFAWLARHVPR